MNGKAIQNPMKSGVSCSAGCVQISNMITAQAIDPRNHNRANMPRIYHILLLLALPAFAQKATWPNAWSQIVDSAGAPCNGCLLYTFVAGSTTPQATYTTPGGGVANTNPVQLSAAGTANIWLTPGQTYRFD